MLENKPIKNSEAQKQNKNEKRHYFLVSLGKIIFVIFTILAILGLFCIGPLKYYAPTCGHGNIENTQNYQNISQESQIPTPNENLTQILVHTDSNQLVWNNLDDYLNQYLNSTKYKFTNGLKENNKVVSINAPTCTMSQKLIWDGNSFQCETDFIGSGSTTSYQNLELNNNILSITHGNSVDLSQYLDNTDVLASLNCAVNEIAKWDGTAWVCSADNGGSTTYSAGTGLSLTGTTFSLNAGIDLLTDVDTSTNAPTNGQVLKWDGSNWVPSNDLDTDTTYTSGGTLLQLSGTQFSLHEGTLTDGNLCTYSTANGLVCNTSTTSVGTDNQTLSWNASTDHLTISGGNTVDMSDLTQTLTLSGTNLSISNGNNVNFTNWDTNVNDDVTELTDLSDVSLTSPINNNQVLKYDGSNWVNSVLNFVDLGDTPSNYGTNGYLVQTDGSGSLTYIDPSSVGTNYWQRNGTDLSPATAGDDVVLNNGETLSIRDMQPGSVLFTGNNGLVSQDNGNLFWNDSRDQLGVGTTSTDARVTVMNRDINNDALNVYQGSGSTTNVVNVLGGNDTDVAESVATTNDGGYIVAGYTYSYSAGDGDVYVAKFQSDGTLDPNFGNNGIVVIGGADDEEGTSIIATTDGGYLVVGSTSTYTTGDYDMYIIKLDALGNLDTTFGNNGTTVIGGNGIDYAYDVKQTADGGYIIVGDTNSYGAGNYDAYIVKLTSTGQLDNNFGTNGTLVVGGADYDYARTVIQTTQGDYLVAGYSANNSAGGSDMYIIKFDSHGNLDNNFGLNGAITIGGVDEDFANDLIQTNDGRFVAVGVTESYGAGDYDMYIVKFDSHGNLDNNFGNNGTFTIGGQHEDFARAVHETSTGDLIITGYTDSFGAGFYDMYVVKLDHRGQLYTSFGNNGTLTIGTNDDDEGYDVTEIGTDDILLVGYTMGTGSGFEDMFIIDLERTGNLGSSCSTPQFGGGGNTGSGGMLGNNGATNVNSGYTLHSGAVINHGGNLTAQCQKLTLSTELALGVDKTARVGIHTGDPLAILDVRGDAIFNNDNDDYDFRIAGSTENNLFFADASANSIGIRTGNPIAVLDVRGGAVFNHNQDDFDVRIASVGDQNLFFTHGSNNSIGIGTNNPDSKLTINNDDATKDALSVYQPYKTDTFFTTVGSNQSEYVRNVLQTKDGGYIIVGYTNGFGAGGYDVYVAKFTRTGQLDTNFGTNGTLTIGTANNDFGTNIKPTNDDGYIIVGYSDSAGTNDGLVAKITASGTLDTSFGNNGILLVGGTNSDGFNSVQPLGNDGYIMTGYTLSYGAGDRDIYVVKMDSYGNLDTSFGTNGTVTIGGTDADISYSIIKTKDGGFVIAGYTQSYGAGNYDMYAIKLTSTGNLDTNFGTNGTVTVGGSSFDVAYSVENTNDNGYILTGYTQNYGTGGRDVYLVKLDASGQLDSNFGINGTLTIGGISNDYGYYSQQTSDNGYIVTGYTSSFGAGGNDIYLIKLDNQGNLDTDFGTNGTLVVGGSNNDNAYSVQQTSDNGFVVSGYTESYGAGGYDMFILKVDRTGHLASSCTDPQISSGGSVNSGGSISSGAVLSSGGTIYSANYSTNGGGSQSNICADETTDTDNLALNVSDLATVGIGGEGDNTKEFMLQVYGNVGPSYSNIYSLGSNSRRWKELFLSGTTLHVGYDLTNEGLISYDNAGKILNINTDNTTKGDISLNNILYIDTSAQSVGIGTTTPDHKLHVVDTVTNQTSAGLTNSNLTTSINQNLASSISSQAGSFISKVLNDSDTRNYSIGASAVGSKIVTSGHSDDGYIAGLWSSAFVSDVNGQHHEGTLNSVMGNRVQFGIYGSNHTGSVDSAMGEYLIPFAQSGTIDKLYGLYIRNLIGDVANIQNYYGIYQEDDDATNYFAGSVGISTSNPVTQFEIGGSTRSFNVQATGGSDAPYGYTMISGGILDYASGTTNRVVTQYGSTDGFAGVTLDATGRVYLIAGTGLNSGDIDYDDSIKMTIRENGNVGIGTVIPTYRLELPNNSDTTGQARANAWVTYSDTRIKSEQKTLDYGLETVLKLQPKEYIHHDSEFVDGQLIIKDTGVKDIGFIAQEVYEVIPEIVHKPSDENSDLWSIDYIRIVPILTNAIQEQNKEIETLKAQVAKLSGKTVKELEEQSDTTQNTATSPKTTSESSSIIDKIAKFIEILTDTIKVKVKAIFTKQVTFEDNVQFKARTYYTDSDLAGYITLQKEQEKVHVKFNKEFNIVPIVNVTPMSDLQGIEYFVNNVTTKGFDLNLIIPQLLKQAETNNTQYRFSWSVSLIENPQDIKPTQTEQSENTDNTSNTDSTNTTETNNTKSSTSSAE